MGTGDFDATDHHEEGVEKRFLSLHARYGSEVISVMGPDNDLLYESDSILRILGYRHAETAMAQAEMLPYIHPDDKEALGRSIEACFATPGEHPPAEFRIQDVDGNWRWLESRGVNLFDDPEIGAVVVSTREITDRKRAEEARRESERRLRAIAEGAPVILFALDAYGRITFDAGRGLSSLDLAPGSTVGLSAFDLYPEDHRVPENVRRSLSGEEVSDTVELESISGRLYFDTLYSPLRDTAGEVEGVIGVATDVTGRKRAEGSLRESEERYRAVVENQTELICCYEPDTSLTFVNEAYCRYFGKGREELVGASFLALIPEADREEVGRRIRHILHRGVEKTHEHRVLAADGSVRWHQWTNRPIRDADGALVEVQCVGRDITERKEAEEALQRSEALYRAVVEDQTELVSRFTPEFELKLVNDSYCRHFGMSQDELIGRNFLDLLPEKSKRAAREHILGLTRQSPVATIEHPAVSREGEVSWIQWTDRAIFDEEGGLLEYQCVGRDVTERKTLEESLSHQALHDPLTGLPGRELVTDHLRNILAGAERSGESAAVLFVDVDNLKLVNDSLGHEAGDRLLCAVGERLRRAVRDEDTVARISGDEFVVSFANSSTEEDALLAAGRILQELEEPLYVNGYEAPVTASVGVAIGPFPGERAEDLIRHADAAMYRAKAAGGGGYSVYNPDMDRADLERLQLSSDLRRAIERGELRAHYQHKIDLSTGKVAGWEALLRWEHPERGMIDPETFIPLAEETGLIVPIGRWVLGQACDQARIWRERHPKEPGQFMSVNLSPKQFLDPGLEEDIERTLRQSGLPAEALDLEITERVLLEDEGSDFARIGNLKRLGLTFSLDDFGTGYSSLSSLKQLPVDCIKIDRSFVESLPGAPEDEAFVSAMVSLARALGLKVVAEGIENAEQWARLSELGCEYGQGYYFATPQPPEEATLGMDRLEEADWGS